ncbi:Adenosylmethionine-8-amino-7-oxononanoate aminotransferase [subsurface metagenome]
MAFAKGVTSGYLPLGGIMVSDEIRDVMQAVPPAKRWMHAYTYSGHPTCCAVALKNLEIIEREGLVERAAEAGERLLDGLKTLYDLRAVGEVRGLGLMAAVAGIVLTGRMNSANALMASGVELKCIAAVVIGGTNLFGGEGTIIGTLIGAIIMGALGNGLNLLNVSAFWQRVVMGVVIVFVVVFDQWRRRRFGD